MLPYQLQQHRQVLPKRVFQSSIYESKEALSHFFLTKETQERLMRKHFHLILLLTTSMIGSQRCGRHWLSYFIGPTETIETQ